MIIYISIHGNEVHGAPSVNVTCRLEVMASGFSVHKVILSVPRVPLSVDNHLSL